MKSPLTKWIFLVFILMSVVVFGGCQNLLVPKNVPIVLWEETSSQSQYPQELSIISYNVICPGIAQDITNSGSALIVLNAQNPGTAFNIDSYDTDTQQLSPFISSDKRELSALYDSDDTGIYYVEESIDPITGNHSSQLLWTDINKNSTRTISLPEENIVKSFGVGEFDQVVYSNNNNEVIIADNQDNRQIFRTLQNLNILSVDYMNNNDYLVFIAYDPTNTEKTNLYYAKINPDSLEIRPNLIAENVTSFNINDLTNQVVFIKNTGDHQKIGTWENTGASPTIVASGNFGTAKYTPNGEKIIYTQHSQQINSQSQSIWIMNEEGEFPMQITAPLNLNSQIVVHPNKSILYFSVDTTLEETDTLRNQFSSQTYQVTYSIE